MGLDRRSSALWTGTVDRRSSAQWTGTLDRRSSATLRLVQQISALEAKVLDQSLIFRDELVHPLAVLTLYLSDMFSRFMDVALLKDRQAPWILVQKSSTIEVLTLSLTDMLSGYLSINQSAMSLWL